MALEIIGLVGRKGAGKTTAAQHLVRTFGFRRMPFAHPLKTMLRAAGLGDAYLEGALKEKPCPLLCGMTPRHAMQTLGTEWGRNLIHPDLWVTLWLEATRYVSDRIVADDVRFENEAATIRAAGGTLIRIERPGTVAVGDAASAHVSETEADGIICTYTVQNTGASATDMLAALDRIVAGAMP